MISVSSLSLSLSLSLSTSLFLSLLLPQLSLFSVFIVPLLFPSSPPSLSLSLIQERYDILFFL